MSEYVTGQIYGWNGGECPVHPKTNIKVWFRRDPSTMGYAGGWVWAHEDLRGDIVCFQVITPYAEPKVIWVNEFRDGRVVAHTSEEMAKTWGNEHHTRIAVEYVEKQK